MDIPAGKPGPSSGQGRPGHGIDVEEMDIDVVVAGSIKAFPVVAGIEIVKFEDSVTDQTQRSHGVHELAEMASAA